MDFKDCLNDKNYYPRAVATFADQSYWLYIDDEYQDFKLPIKELHLCLFLRELEGYAITPDYKEWCHERFLDHELQQVQMAYAQLKEVYTKISMKLGSVDSFVSDFDFELNSGAAQALRSLA